MNNFTSLALVALIGAAAAACGDSGGPSASDTVAADSAALLDTSPVDAEPGDTTSSDTGGADDTAETTEDTAGADIEPGDTAGADIEPGDTAGADIAPGDAAGADTTVTDTTGADTAVADTTVTDTTVTDTTVTDTTVTDTTVADSASGDTTVSDTSAADTSAVTDTTPSCPDDTLAGTEAAPADLVAINAAGPTYHVCPGVRDAFQFTAEAGDVVKITLVTVGANPDLDTTPGGNDIDMYLYAGAVTNQNIVASGATAAAVEQIVHVIATTGTYLLVVEDYEGSAADYTLSFSVARSCTVDADCSGGDICYVGIDDENLILTQECRAYAAPACGQGSAEDATSSHSDGTAVAFDAVATGSAFTGSLCGGDVDVFRFPVAAGDSLIANLSGVVPDAGLILGTWVGPDGAVLDSIQLAGQATSGDFTALFVAAPGDYYLYLDLLAGGSATADVSYTLTARTASPCLLDADCTGGEVCGLATTNGPLSVCSPYQADVCGADDDNSQSHATALTSGVAVATEVVCGTGDDWYRITVSAAHNDLTATLTWSGAADLDLYLLSAAGVPYGAGWFGTNAETVTGQDLPPGTYFLIVDEYASDGAGTTGVGYTLTATATASPSGCVADAGCGAGGTNANDPRVDLSCDSAGGVCQPGVAAGLGALTPGADCFDGRGANYAGQCAYGGVCAGVCLTFCNAQADCDADWGGGDVAYCLSGAFTIGDLCLPRCDSPSASGYLWGDAECTSLGFAGCDASSHECAFP